MSGNDAPIRINPSGRYAMDFDDPNVDWSRAVPPSSNGGIRQPEPAPLSEGELANQHNPTMLFNWPLPENHPALQRRPPPAPQPRPKRTQVSSKPNAPPSSASGAKKAPSSSATTRQRPVPKVSAATASSRSRSEAVEPSTTTQAESENLRVPVPGSSRERESMRSLRRDETLRELEDFQRNMEQDELRQLAEIWRGQQQQQQQHFTDSSSDQTGVGPISSSLDEAHTDRHHHQPTTREVQPTPPNNTVASPQVPESLPPVRGATPPPDPVAIQEHHTPTSTPPQGPGGNRSAGLEAAGVRTAHRQQRNDGGVAGAFAGPHGLPGAIPQLQRLLQARRRGEIQRAGDHMVVYNQATLNPSSSSEERGMVPPVGQRAVAVNSSSSGVNGLPNNNAPARNGAIGGGGAGSAGGGWEISDFSYESLLELGSMAVPTGLGKDQLAQYKPTRYVHPGKAGAKKQQQSTTKRAGAPSSSKISTTSTRSRKDSSSASSSVTAGGRKSSSMTTTTVKIEDEDCSICLDSLVEGDDSLRIGCGHVFHHACLIEWLARTNRCPTCRFEIPRKKK